MGRSLGKCILSDLALAESGARLDIRTLNHISQT